MLSAIYSARSRTNTNCRKGTLIAAAWVLCLSTIVGQANAVPLTLTGQVTTAGSSFTIADLQRLGSTTQTVGGNTYVGVSLWSLLGGTSGGASNVITSGGGNNPILKLVIATGSDGAQWYISIGEINPLFGGGGQPYLVAYEQNGATLASPALIVPKDTTGARNVTSLANLSVASVPRPPVGPGGTTNQFSLSGVDTPGTYDLAALQTLPATTVDDVTFFAGPNPIGPRDYTGVSLWTLLTTSGMASDHLLTSYLLATGSDGYEVLYSLAELNPAFGASPDLVAYAVDGTPFGSDGFVRIVKPGDFRGGRYVSNLASLQVVVIPEPSLAVLLGAGLFGIFLSRRRKVASVVVRRRP